MSDKYSVEDLINLAMAQKPVEFGQTFNSIMTDKLTAAVDNKKTEIAAKMFNNKEEDSEEEERDEICCREVQEGA